MISFYTNGMNVCELGLTRLYEQFHLNLALYLWQPSEV